MDEAIGGRPSIQPPCLSMGREPFHVHVSVPGFSDTPGPGNVAGTDEPGPPKKQRCDAVLELFEREEKRAEERDRRAEAREERLLNLLEKIVEKM